MIKSFYNSYIIEKSKKPPRNEEKIDTIINKYWTKRLKNYIDLQFKEYELDYDPFIKGQMFDIRILKTLTVRHDLKSNNIYYVSFTFDTIIRKTTTIKLTILKEKGSYKIDNVALDNKGNNR
jgi:hypothetical protein